MRLHELQITAFGPFADTVTVDFSALSEAGLFLLTGPTGAGKTSVLDAVCFALYGDVPGDRATAKRLRSDQALADVVPRVELDCTLSGRRLRITRTPTWERPKKRGQGTTRQQASVTVSELVDGAWVARATRPDEAGHLIGELLGLTMTQFTQVAMLPQGRFQAFLRARADERQKLLQHLFQTDRFEQIERWLTDHRVALVRSSRDHQQTFAELTNRVSEAAGEPVPAGWEQADLAPVVGSGELLAWAHGLAQESHRDAQRAVKSATRGRHRADAAAAEVTAAREVLQRQHEHAELAAQAARLATFEAQIQAARESLVDAQRAETVIPLVAAAADADRLQATRSTTLFETVARLDLHVEDAEVEGLANSIKGLRDQIAAQWAVATALAPRQIRLRTLGSQVDEWRADRIRSTARAQELEQQVSMIATQIGSLRKDRDDAAQAAVRVPSLQDALARAESALSAATQVVDLAQALSAADDLRRMAADEALTLKERWLGLQERRITGMAAALANQLVVGSSCPVCGSHDHPNPAAGDADLPDAAAERHARALVDDAEAARVAHDDAVRDLATRLAASSGQAAGLSIEEAASTRDDAAARLEAALTAAGSLVAVEQALVTAESAAATLTAEQREIREAVARLDAAIGTAEDEVNDIRCALVAELGDEAEADLLALSRSSRRRVEELDAALTSARQVEEGRAAAEAAHKRASAAARKAGFRNLDAVATARLDAQEIERRQTTIATHDATVTTVRSRLDDPDLTQAAQSPAPDLARLQAVLAEHTRAATAAQATADVLTARTSRITELTERLVSADEQWAPVRAQLALATRMSTLAEGKSADNRLQMRLSAYVLAHRLAQVVAAANARLHTMSDRRFTLEHSGRRGAGETRGGLSLLIRDDWSGEARDPATLSGGETFVVSLALALGLADVIAQEVGGADLDTLFVDEGFGSLDAETLDDVLDTLDTLRDGGRVVGVVSHVAEMRDRIPTRLSVVKRRRGSTVQLVRPA